MAQVSVYDMNGNEVSTLELNKEVFGIEPNAAILHAAVVNYLANQRKGNQSTLTRSEVRGGGKKPWRQKGTGRARHGSTRSPQWRTGGVAFAPKPRSYRYALNKKVRRIAMKSALSTKVIDGDMMVLDNLKVDEYKTKTMVKLMSALGADRKALLVLSSADDKIIRSAANIPGVKTTQVNTLNVYDILNYDKFIVVKEAVSKIEEVYA
ncbi:MAG: 50S ribosomal protein L4 [Oscillospiraceae bacterium]|jgi:large subunit ribosomal protein L4|nr:50S ribosomal protein L4 [Oscillospiraceae bacterium]